MIKKQIIMDNALELFAKQGFKATSIQQITDKSGISKGAFYLSFKSKDELIIAVIDHFMMKFVSDIDHLVNIEKEADLLHAYYFTTYTFFYKHVDFANIFMKEQVGTFNEALIEKMRSYEKLMEKSILHMIHRLYKNMNQANIYDLLFCIKNFTNLYFEAVLFSKQEIDFNLLARSLVEKTNILAKEITLPFITETNFPVKETKQIEISSAEELIDSINQHLIELGEGIEKDSLILLKQELTVPELHPAIIKGLIENLQSHEHLKWLAYLLKQYFGRNN